MSRKGENIYHRKDGRWEARYIRSRSEDGKAVYGYVYGKTYKEAREKRLHAMIIPIRKNPGKRNAKMFSALSASWLTENKPKWKESTMRKYEQQLITYLIPAFGNRPFCSITTDEMSGFFSRLIAKDCGAGLSPSTVRPLLSIMKQIREHAARSGIPSVFDPSQIRIAGERRNLKTRAFSREEQKKLVEEITAHPDPYGMGVLLCLFTGIRLGELCALKWEDLDLEGSRLSITKTLQRISTGNASGSRTALVVDSTKTASSTRVIPIMEELAVFLRKRVIPGAFFLSGDLTKPADPRVMEKHFKKLLKQCGVEDADFHATRRTFATRCVEKGVDAKTLSELLGHSDISTTLRYYVHPSMAHKKASVELLTDLFAVKERRQA